MFAEDDFEEFSTNTWDLAFCAFENALLWYLLLCLYISYADKILMSKLLLLNRYREGRLLEENHL